MSNSMKTIVFIISLIAYFIYSTISSGFVRAAYDTGNVSYLALVVYAVSGIGILLMLYIQAGVKYHYASRPMRGAKIHVTLPLEKFRLTDRLVVYLLPALGILIPIAQQRSLKAIQLPAVIFFFVVIAIVELLFFINSKTMKAYITNKGIMIRGIDLRLELPLPSNYHNPSGYYPFERIINFMDLNDRLLIEQSYDMGIITLKADRDTLTQVKGVLLANKVIQKKF